MKKTGFTLAEVLVTLGIVGIISALTIPTFTAQTQRAKIGPKLGKAVSSFEQATKAILDDAQVDRLNRATVAAVGGCGTNTTLAHTGCFSEYLGHHMKGSRITHGNGTDSFYSADGTEYIIPMYSTPSGESSTLAHQRRFFELALTIDINGAQGPDDNAKDRFYFHIMEDGSLRPMGGSWEASDDRWMTKCQKNAKPTDATKCAGHIMENGLKAEYKL